MLRSAATSYRVWQRGAAGTVAIALVAVGLAWVIHLRVRNAANNDVLLQLLAVEGIASGKGYGFTTSAGAFYSIGSRPAETRWPPGLTVIALLLGALSQDPHTLLARLQPVLGALSFLLLYWALRQGLGARLAALATVLASLSTTVWFDWHTEVSSESWFFLALGAAILWVALDGMRRFQRLIGPAWTMVMFRSAGGYCSLGLAVAYAVARRNSFPRVLWEGFWRFLVLAAPLIAFHGYFGIKTRNGLGHDVSLSSQLAKQIFWQHEILLPHTEFMKRHEVLGFALGSACFLWTVFLCWRFFRQKSSIGVLLVSCGAMGAGYMVSLAVSAVIARYDWGAVYRVSGVSTVLMGIVFWGGTLNLPQRPLFRRILLAAAVSVFLLKAGWYLKGGRTTAMQHDYRETVARFEAFAKWTGESVIPLCAEKNTDRNFSRSLLYASKMWWRPSVRIYSLEFFDPHPSARCARFDGVAWTWASREGGGQ